MIDTLRQLAIFAKTAEHQPFRQAAKALELSPSVVSYHISKLEQHYETALFYRTTRKLSLTHAGKTLFQKVQLMMDSADMALDSINNKKNALSGELSITMAGVLCDSPIMTKIAAFSKAHPMVKINFIVSDKRVDIISKGIDIAIRLGPQLNEQSTLKKIPLGQLARRLVASPDCIAGFPEIKQPADLNQFPFIGLSSLSNKRQLFNKAHIPFELTFKPKLVADNLFAIQQLCLHGMGVAILAEHSIQRELTNNQLSTLLPDWHVEPIELNAFVPIQAKKQSLTEQLLDFLR